MIEGLIAAPLTPMGSDGSLKLEMIEEQAAFLARNGVKGARARSDLPCRLAALSARVGSSLLVGAVP